MKDAAAHAINRDLLLTAHDRIEQLEREKAELVAEEKALRRLLAMTYCPVPHLYADDGELQDNRAFPAIDFKKETARG